MRRVRAKAGKQEDYHGGSIIPDEIMFEIQVRLPPKSVFRFKCVCKAWLSLFQDESFVDLYSTRRREESTTLRLVERDDDYYNLFSITQDGALETTCLLDDEDRFAVPDDDYTLMPPCRGLFCFRQSKRELNVWNPTTNETITLPLPKRLRRAARIGFGFDIVSKKFKVIGREYDRSSNIHVLTVGEQEWRCVEGGTIETTSPLFDHVIYLNGALYWFTTQLLTRPGADYWYDRMRGGNCKITSFNLANESFEDVALPSQEAGFVNLEHRLSQVEGCLCLIGHDYNHLDMWILSSPSKWTHRRISLPFEVTVPLDTPMPIRNGEILVQCRKESCLYLCQYDTNTATQQQPQCRLLKTTKVTGFTHTPAYILGKHEDTLVSLKNYM